MITLIGAVDADTWVAIAAGANGRARCRKLMLVVLFFGVINVGVCRFWEVIGFVGDF